MDKSDYQYPYFSEEAKYLLVVAGLPLLDGYFLAFLAGNMWSDFWKVVGFGLTAFSGAACILTAMKMRGNLPHRLVQVSLVYLVVAFAAIFIASASNILSKIVPENISVFTALFLLGLAFTFTGNKFLAKVADFIGARSVVGAILLILAFNAMKDGISGGLYLDPHIVIPVSFAIGLGYMLTVLGTILGYFTKNIIEVGPMRWGAGISLIIMAFTVLGFQIGSYWVLPPLIIGLLFSVLSGGKNM